MNKFVWEQADTPGSDKVQELARVFDIPTSAARFLAARGFTVESARRYLEPAEGQPHDPFLFDNMGRAVECVRKAVETKARVLIHGDYDVDGICGTALLYHYLRDVVPKVLRYLPDRRKDGYGIAGRAVDWAVENRVGLFIAVDCGTSDGELIARLESEGIDVIVCDHHELSKDNSASGIMLNPSRPEEGYPFKGLCGTGVAFKLVRALESTGITGAAPPASLLDFLAVATVADLAPLVDENRYYVQEGLKQINGSSRLGLDALMSASGLDKPEVNSYHIGFILAPRINAPGRISNAKPALELLCTDNEERAADLAQILESDNYERRLLTERVHDEVMKMIEDIPDRHERGGYVLAGENWNEGVLGIAAARVVDEFGKPAVLISVQGDSGKGSGRSVPGVDLKEQLDRCGQHLTRYGGHAQAVGLTIAASKVEAFADELSCRLSEATKSLPRRPLLRIDAELALRECSLELVDFLTRCEPFGKGNKSPLWVVRDVVITPGTRYVGKGHLKLHFRDSHGEDAEGICFNWDTRNIAAESLQGLVVDLAVSIKKGYYLERHYPEIQVLDIREHEG
ncbi:MAG: single-stranded-DNA-specific exonuclease RecJ [Candidatus Latescibacterota bacterium]|nr:MAG: single-stranded-DNA-specific exonuclease RecJ [Candidatus Latescibacterota bacterium]